MKRAIVAFLIGVAVTLLAFLVVGLAGGACHCNTPFAVMFPYGTFLEMRMSQEDLGTLALLLQFPIYALAVALPATDLRRAWSACGVAALHLAAAFVSATSHGSFR